MNLPDQLTVEWMREQAHKYQLVYLLAHADDGVIWGRFENGKLVTSHDVAPNISPRLRPETLQQCRLFGPQAEILLWRDAAGWHGRLAQEKLGDKHLDELHILWGTDAVYKEHNFTLLTEGQRGLRHVVPIPVEQAVLDGRALKLRVRHILGQDQDGCVQIQASRLVGFGLGELGQKAR